MTTRRSVTGPCRDRWAPGGSGAVRRAPAMLAGVVAGVVGGLGRIGPAMADEGHLHIGGLSSGQSWLVIGAGATVSAVFVVMFVLAWLRSGERGGPDESDEPGEGSDDAVRER